ncbi:hypothetical protein FGSG_04695 [Fusarium graminearum PH-1]|uniref:Chromosome 3, complete genome n=1 Tax=Gibberella zeae (strain ATCC MYA-4620 / CBS 123657 / FGSC 9075 / NRRL 31084 / PH-1) TaxID=229533 RepID=I1RLA8_GIBZE|nr:hypothetical protein FGSG_04695 [Fusarium graminearum PH-1]ESU10551.1 hypothetical protein FGSG_04695 [Fusarium graminearum PH-1]EYB31475.1 hypothetical protein FG05_04695 [Fusarium graminearum]CAF3519648.1 unnamed protein product [Fusarium graminearum]CEF88847.1 unnamed protein product [Fusarium graminearum]|eukprot:XP_011323127.1 hypothetical protein FGSG_04695 [Fusarium graminearum PH-1]
MEDSTALITRHHVEHAQPKDRYLYSENNALPPTHDGYMDIDEAWRRFEVARRSAEFYMDQYFQNLEAGTAQPRAGPNSRSSLAPLALIGVRLGTSSPSNQLPETSDTVETRGGQLRDGRYWNRKAARDSLIRDLNEMGFWIAQLSSSQQFQVKIPICVACFSGIVMSGLQHVRSQLLQWAVYVGKIAALLAMASSLGYMIHGRRRVVEYSRHKESISQCLDAVYGWALTNGHQKVVTKKQYWLLKRLS